MKTLLPALVLVICLVSSATARCPAGDLTGDCKVNVLDLQTFAEQWLKSTEGGSADINGDDNVDMIDLSLLANQWHLAGIPLVINEFMASNSKYPDPQDECDDWIEIYNAGDEAIDIAGMYLIDDLNKPAMWRVPSGNPSLTTIQSHKYLLIWADEDITDAGLHASFKLDTDNGDRIWLFDKDGRTLIDSVIFGSRLPTSPMVAILTATTAGNLWAFLRLASQMMARIRVLWLT